MANEMSPDDNVAVMNLIADYALRYDSSDLDGYVANFTADGVWEGRAGSFVGHDAIRTYVGGLMDAPTRRKMCHVLGTPSIHGDGRRCTAVTYVMIPAQTSDREVTIPLVGVYRDEIVKVDGRWLFAHRIADMELTSAARCVWWTARKCRATESAQ